jgi:hypothetical protein
VPIGINFACPVNLSRPVNVSGAVYVSGAVNDLERATRDLDATVPDTGGRKQLTATGGGRTRINRRARCGTGRAGDDPDRSWYLVGSDGSTTAAALEQEDLAADR